MAAQGIEDGQIAAVVCEIAQAAAALPRRRRRDGAAGGGGGRGRRDLEIIISREASTATQGPALDMLRRRGNGTRRWQGQGRTAQEGERRLPCARRDRGRSRG